MGIPRITPRTLKAGWGTSRESRNDLHTVYGPGVHRCDSRFLNNHLAPIVDELEKRGYDLKTLKFSITLKPEQSTEKEQ